MNINVTMPRCLRTVLLALLPSAVIACGGGGGGSENNPGGSPNPPNSPDTGNAILFVGQTPIATGDSDIATVTGTFSTHLPRIESVPRGGSLFIRYPDGTLRDLLDDALAEACASGRPTCDENGVFNVDNKGLLLNGYAVREPTVHWDGNRVIFSLLRGAIHEQFGDQQPEADPVWQIHEIAGLGQDDEPVLTRLPNQPAAYNNVSPIYGSNEGVVFFTSDRPVTGNPLHYPQLEEYESGPTVSGLWRLDSASGELQLIDHAPSGDFTPFLGSDGVIYFTRWDHLQQDQQALIALSGVLRGEEETIWQAYTYTDENDSGPDDFEYVSDFVRAKLDEGDVVSALYTGELGIPEYHNKHPVWTSDQVGSPIDMNDDYADLFPGKTKYTPEDALGPQGELRFNLFFPWQIRQDGSGNETLRHFGRHEAFGFIMNARPGDPNTRNMEEATIIRDGMFNVTQDVDNPADFYGAIAPEFGTHAAGSLLRIRDTRNDLGMHEVGNALEFEPLTDPESDHLFRNPVMLSDGRLLASMDEIPGDDKTGARDFHQFRFRLYTFADNDDTGFMEAAAPLLDDGIARRFDYWEASGQKREFDGVLWELTPVEVKSRPRPPLTSAPPLEAPEAQVFADAGVEPDELREWLADNDLALLVMRNVTTRDAADRQQPVDLQAPDDRPPGSNGVATTAGGIPYAVEYLRYFEAKFLRGYGKYASGTGADFDDGGRRVLARPMDFTAAFASNLDGKPDHPETLPIYSDGSVAALVPANRAVTWAMTDADLNPVVRERYWLKFAPGEVRVCASCHGVNDDDQSGQPKPENAPDALRDFLEQWKLLD